MHIDNILHYVVNILKNPGVARAIIIAIEEAYNRLEYMAETFGYCNDRYLADRGYRKIALSGHDYLILYRVEGQEVRISGGLKSEECELSGSKCDPSNCRI